MFFRLIRYLAINYHSFSYGFKCPDAKSVLLKMTNVMVTSNGLNKTCFAVNYCLSRDNIKYCTGDTIKSTQKRKQSM